MSKSKSKKPKYAALPIVHKWPPDYEQDDATAGKTIEQHQRDDAAEEDRRVAKIVEYSYRLHVAYLGFHHNLTERQVLSRLKNHDMIAPPLTIGRVTRAADMLQFERDEKQARLAQALTEAHAKPERRPAPSRNR